jgi:hypothetical protein
MRSVIEVPEPLYGSHESATLLVDEFLHKARSRARESDVDCIGPRFRIGQQIRHGFVRRVKVRKNHHGERADQCHRLEVLCRIEWHRGIEELIQHMRAISPHEQGVAVGSGSRHLRCANVAARARTVLHDQRLPKRATEMLGQIARCDVGPLPGLIGNDDTNRLRRIGLSQSRMA